MIRLLIKLCWIQKRLRCFGSSWLFVAGRNPMDGTQHHQFRIAFLRALAAKEIAQDWDVSQARNLVVDVGHAVVHQSCDHEALSILQLELGLRFPCTECGNGESGNCQRVRKVECAYFGCNLEMDVAVRSNDRRELQPYAEFLEGDGHSRKAIAGLNNWKRELATSKET